MTKASSGSSNGQKIAFSMKFPGLGGMGFRVSWDLPTLLQGHQEISKNSRNTHNVLPILRGPRPAFHPLAQGRSSHWKAKLPGQEESGISLSS